MSAARPSTHTRAIESAAQRGAFSSSKSHRDTVKLLRSLANALIAASGEAGSIPIAAIAHELSVDNILKTSRPDIHLSAVLCFVELFKLSAPSPPWHGETLCDILRMLIKQVALIGDSESSQVMTDQFHIIESLAVVKIPIVLLEEDIDEDSAEANMNLLVELFQTSMQIASRALPQQFENCIRDMLSCVLEEADPVPKPPVMVLITALTDRSPGAQRSSDLAKRVIRECKGFLEPAITSIIDQISSKPTCDIGKQIGSRSRQSELIYELAVLDPGLLRGSTHCLQDALESPNEELRMQFVKLFGRIFSNSTCEVANEFLLLLNAFLKRATDISGRIREEFVTYAAQILAHVPEVRVQLTTILTERSLDPCDKVRSVLVRSICDLALNSPEVVEFSLLDAIGGRILDKKASVRLEAIQGLSSLFKTHCSRYWSESNPVPAGLKKFSWVPKKLISLFMVSFPDRSHSLDHVIDEMIIDKSLEAHGRTLLLTAIFTTCDVTHQKAFIKHYITDKHQAATILNDALNLRDQLRSSDCDEDLCAKLTLQRDQRLQSLTPYLPSNITLNLLQALFDERDGNIFKWLRFCIDNARDTIEIRAAMSELHGALSTSKKLQATADSVAFAVAMITLGRDNIPHLFDIAAHHANKKLASDARTLLLALAEQAPVSFTSHLQPVADTVKFTKQSSDISDFSLHVISLCSASNVPGCPKLSVLERFCREGSEEQSSWASAILCHTPAAASSLKGLLDQAGFHLNNSSNNLAPLLSSYATIARLRPQLFHDHDQSEKIVEFALASLSDQPSISLNCICLRLVSDYVVGLEENVTGRDTTPTGSYRESILSVLWSLLSTPTTTPSPLLSESISSIVNLLTVVHIEGSISPNEFSVLAGVILRAPDDSVRNVFVDQLWKRLVVLRLPFRYATLLSLIDHNQELMKRSKKLLAVLVTRLRQASAIAIRSGSKAISPSQMPEYALAHLLHALASQPDFDETDVGQLRAQAKLIGAFLDALLSSHYHNFAFIIALMTQLRSCIPLSGTDKTVPPERLYALVDLTMIIIKRKYQGQEWSSLGEDRISKKVPLPASWFRMLPGPVEGSYLPPKFVLKLSPLESSFSPSRTPTKKQLTPKPERKTPGRNKRRKSVEPESSPPIPSRQLPPRRAKTSLRSLSSFVDSDEDFDIISHEERLVSESDPTNGTQIEPMEVEHKLNTGDSEQFFQSPPRPGHAVHHSSLPSLQDDDGTKSQSMPPHSDSEQPSLKVHSPLPADSPNAGEVASSSLIDEKDGEKSKDFLESQSSPMRTSHAASPSPDLIDVLMNGSETVNQDNPMDVAPASTKDEGERPEVLRSTFRLTRSRRRA